MFVTMRVTSCYRAVTIESSKINIIIRHDLIIIDNGHCYAMLRPVSYAITSFVLDDQKQYETSTCNSWCYALLLPVNDKKTRSVTATGNTA